MSGLRKVIHDGTVVTINVMDPNGRVSFPDKYWNVKRESRFAVGVTMPSGSYSAATLVSTSRNQHVLKLVVPRQSSLKLTMDTELSVTDDSGVPQGPAFPAKTISAGALQQLDLNFNVK